MTAIKAIYKDGQIHFSETVPASGPVEVMVVFPEPSDDPWERILQDPRPRPNLTKLVQEVDEQIAQGKAVPLDLDQL